MNRRNFLQMIGAGAATLSAGGIALLEPVLNRTYFLPPKGGWPKPEVISWQIRQYNLAAEGLLPARPYVLFDYSALFD
jgi:hypothetical protein